MNDFIVGLKLKICIKLMQMRTLTFQKMLYDTSHTLYRPGMSSGTRELFGGGMLQTRVAVNSKSELESVPN